jgi:glutathione S-transferase
VVPTLVIDNQVLTQSVAILEYLEERRPESWRLMPMEAIKKAHVRALVMLIAADIQPIQNMRVLMHVGEACGGKSEWARHWITLGLQGADTCLMCGLIMG